MTQDSKTTPGLPQKPGKEDKGGLLLNQDFEIFPAQPLAEYGTPTSKAYYAQNVNDPSLPYFALICGIMPPPRLDEIKIFTTLSCGGTCLVPQSYGSLYWPAARQKQLALVYSRPLGGPLVTPSGDLLKKIPETDIISFLMRIVPLLQELVPLKTSYRAIRAENLYFLDQSQTVITLGECLSAPPGYHQPALYETIYRSMVPPESRGMGDSSDDLYALGVTTLLLLLGRNPVKALSSQDLLKKKIREGSYGVLVGSTREISTSMNEFLRGVLVDDPVERWTLDQVSLWLEGKRSSPKQSTRVLVSSRPFRFRDEEYNTAQELVYEFSRNWQDAIKALSKPLTLSAWVKRNLSKEEEGNKIENFVTQLGRIASGKINDQNRIVSSILMNLCPQAPIFWGKNAYMLDGLASAFALDSIQGKASSSSVLPIIRERLVPTWINLQRPISSRLSALEQRYDSLAFFIDNPVIGYGIERCLYFLNPGLPCLSPLVIQDYVYNLSDLLPALNRAISQDPDIPEIFDRHIAAFIASRLPQISQADLEVLSHPDPSRLALGRLGLFKKVQEAYKLKPLPELVTWFINQSEPIIASYSSRKLRQRLQDNLKSEGEGGNLERILNLLNNPTDRTRDREDFLLAQQEYRDLDKDIVETDKKYISDVEKISSFSRGITSGFSVIIGSISLLVIGIYFYSGAS